MASLLPRNQDNTLLNTDVRFVKNAIITHICIAKGVRKWRKGYGIYRRCEYCPNSTEVCEINDHIGLTNNIPSRRNTLFSLEPNITIKELEMSQSRWRKKLKNDTEELIKFLRKRET